LPGSKEFKLNFLRMEQHILLPNTTSIILAQNLYEILFQYVIDRWKPWIFMMPGILYSLLAMLSNV
jgi:hypothetical protein